MPRITIKETTIKSETRNAGSLAPGELFRMTENGIIYMLSGCPAYSRDKINWQKINIIDGTSELIDLKTQIYPINGEVTLTIAKKS